MKTKKTTLTEKQTVFFRLALLALVIWLFISYIQLRVEIDDKRSALNELQAQISSQQQINEVLSEENANDDLYLEQHARNNGLAKPGESIYKEVPGGANAAGN